MTDDMNIPVFGQSPVLKQSPVARAVNHLGLSLLKALTKEGEGNVFISPFSLSTALAMLHCGSRGETSSEMRHVFGYEDAGIADDQVAWAFSELISSFDKASDSYVLSCANSLVAQKKFSVKDEYKKLLQESFRAMLYEADFAKESEKAKKDINEWVKGKTNGMIPQLLGNLSPMTVMVLLNAIYFKGTWMNKFKESSTKQENFYNGGLKKNAKKVRMMHQKESFRYAERETFAVLQLPYVGGDIAMLILLPSSLNGLEELEEQLTPELLNELKGEMRQTKVTLQLPRFRFEYSKTTMKETLQAVGLTKVFESGADLGGMSDGSLIVSLVIHKAVIEVNEEGSEAAAATAILIGRSLRKERVADFIVDHPFLFAIHDIRNGAILFLGKICEL